MYRTLSDSGIGNLYGPSSHFFLPKKIVTHEPLMNYLSHKGLTFGKRRGMR